MIKIIQCLALCVLLGWINSSRISHYICKTESRKCVFNSAISKIYCQESKCSEHYSYKCGFHECALNKKVCQDYLNTASTVRMFASFGGFHTLNKEYYNKVVAQCPIETIQLNLSDVCIRSNKCSRIGLNNSKKAHSCTCPEDSFQCGNKYCTSTKHECKRLISIEQSAKLENIIKIKEC